MLEKIIANKKKEVEKKKKFCPPHLLEKERFFQKQVLSLTKAIKAPQGLGIIAAYKRQSPFSAIKSGFSLEAVTRAYKAYGASAIAVHTDLKFFSGSTDDLVAARDNGLPLLREDFIIDEYQLVESKAYGADAVLLQAQLLSKEQVRTFAGIAANLGLEVLLEIAGKKDLDDIPGQIKMVAINNRGWNGEKANIERSLEMANAGKGLIKISFGGISGVEDVRLLRKAGYRGFIMGSCFLSSVNPMQAFKEFSYEL